MVLSFFTFCHFTSHSFLNIATWSSVFNPGPVLIKNKYFLFLKILLLLLLILQLKLYKLYQIIQEDLFFYYSYALIFPVFFRSFSPFTFLTKHRFHSTLIHTITLLHSNIHHHLQIICFLL